MKKRLLILSALVLSSASAVMADPQPGFGPPKLGENATAPAGSSQCVYKKLIEEAQAPLPADSKPTNVGSAS
jgi:hypothetical protein